METKKKEKQITGKRKLILYYIKSTKKKYSVGFMKNISNNGIKRHSIKRKKIL